MPKLKKEIEDIRTMAIDELNAKVSEAEKDLFTMKFNLSTGQLDNTSKIENTRRQIARMKTVLTERKSKK